MAITIGKHAGFCHGVKTAVRLATEACEKGPCWVIGDLIHNKQVMEQLKEKGLSVADSVDQVAGGSVIIRSHGAAPETYEKLSASGASIIDATCSNVSRVHRIVSAYSEDGRPVIIAGEPTHPEIQATAGWCKGPVYIVQSAEESLALPAMDQALVVAQTTLPDINFKNIVSALKKRVRSLSVENTICKATHDRQMEAETLALDADVVLVLGSKNSANTKALYHTCKRHCESTYWLESAADLPIQGIQAVDHIAITAGASTPEWSLKEVATRMNDLENNVPMEAETQPVVGEELAVTNETAQLQAEEVSSATAEEAPVAAEATNAPVPDVSATEAAPMEEEPPKANSVTAENSFMADIEATLVAIRPGQTITGTVVQITEDEVCVNIGYKSDGLVKRSDLVTTDIGVGDPIEVEVVKVNDGEGNVILSQRNIINRRNWDALMEKYERGEYIDGVGKEAVKGGLIANVEGIRAFIPASQLSQRYVEKVEDFVGKDLQLKVIEVDKAKRRIVCSRKAVILELAAERKKEIWEKLEVGSVINGTVRRLTDFGVFVDVGGLDGLVHVTDLSWGRVRHPSEIVSPNQEITVKILSLDMERERIQLGYKQTQRRPWEIAEEKYPVGAIVEGRVVRITTFGAFVELEPGLDGLVHISQCALTRIAKVEDAVQVGQVVRVKVLSVDPQAKRISLSIRAAQEEEAFNYSDDLPGDDLMADTEGDVYATPVDYSQHMDEAEPTE